MSPFSNRVPAGPFIAVIEQRIAFHKSRALFPATNDDCLRRVAEEFGWEGENGIRRLYRFRHGLKATKQPPGRRGKSVELRTDSFAREAVEDALHHAGIDFYSVYTEFAFERDIELEPAAWCPACQSHETPIDGCCPWCDWRISEGHMNRQAA